MDPKRSPGAVSYDGRSFRLAGKRRLLVSGEIHYPRLLRDEWAAVLDASVACGINCISTYVFWNLHEPEKDRYDFSGDRDLGHFLDLCHERGLAVLLRLGPYICAEWNYGGFPFYLRDIPGIEIRTFSAPYLERVERYFTRLAAEVLPRLATRGGPVALVQVENEYDNVAKRYGADGARYLAWMADLAVRLGFDVPTVTCESASPDSISCRVEGTVECLNGFSIEAERIERLQREHPNQPVFWTELWPGWYDTWGREEHRRDMKNIACAVLDFIGRGGAGWNYYMWFAGTNFARFSMYLQTPRYGLDAPLDEFGGRTAKAELLAQMHHALLARQDLLFEGARTKTQRPNGEIETRWRLGTQELILRQSPAAEVSEVGGAALLRGRAQLSDGQGNVLFDSGRPASPASRAPERAWSDLPGKMDWQHWEEPMPCLREDTPLRADDPIEQLLLTKDRSDYCWYSATIEVSEKGECQLDIPFGGDFFHVWMDGNRIAFSSPPFRENRGPTLPETPERPRIIANMLDREQGGFSHSFSFRASPGRHRLDLLATALGLVKGDWQIAGPMASERKGIWQGVFVDGARVKGWEMFPALRGEVQFLPGAQPPFVWSNSLARGRAATWYRTEFTISEKIVLTSADFRLDAEGLGKGGLFLNGRMLCRHWLIEAAGYGPDEGWQDKPKYGLSSDPSGPPTQRFYLIPRSWLRTGINTLVVFEEHSSIPSRVRIQMRHASLIVR